VKLPVLLYHRVGPPRLGPHPELSVPPAQFRREVALLARLGYRAIAPSEWLAWLRGEGALPPRPVLLTFDDAYAELEEHALPVLEAHGFRAAVFVATGLLGRAAPWDGHPLAEPEALPRWTRSGVEFGGHTRTHPDLTTLSPAEAAGEIAGGADDLTALTGCRPTSFAYPSGRHAPAVRAAAAAVFALAFTCEPGLNGRDTPPDRMHRTMVLPGDTRLDLLARLRGTAAPVRSARAALSRLRPAWTRCLR
jgi:peptidoglycan/xylan/chitin deacetylase (PgdA/CDA1 family)